MNNKQKYERHTLYEWRKHFKGVVTSVSLRYANHLVNIQFDCEGSAKLLRVFNNEQFYYVSFIDGHLVLSINKED